jgi:hypothetical protein
MADDKEQPIEKRIIIDEDWKAQVQEEKSRAAGTEQPSEKRTKHPLPPASISFLFSTLATQAIIALGALPHPVTNKAEKHLDQAKHFIDTLGVLEEKTKGNLTADEKRRLEAILFDLRLQFVEASSKAKSHQSEA